MINFYDKKGISAVVTVALLLVVSIVVVVGFQGWFSSYLSGDFVKIEQQTGSSGDIRLEKIIDNTLWIINNIAANYSIDRLEIDGNICNNISNLDLGLNAINISDCIVNISSASPSVVMYTGDKITEKYFYVKDAVIGSNGGSSLDCSTLNGGEWISVPGNSFFGTLEFCVMKYEAKNDLTVNCGGTSCPNSSAISPPWTSISQINAKIECESLNTGTGHYHLITNAEWMTIARNIEQQNINWVNSTGGVTSVGVGSLKQGNVGATGIVGASYDGTNPEQSSEISVNPNKNLGSLQLSNGEVIWDLSGNVWEWNNDTLNMHTDFINGVNTDGYWDTQSNATFRLNAGPSNSTWGQNEGVGYVWDSNIMSHAFLRGGLWYNGASAGAFALDLSYGPSDTNTNVGFRCSFEP